MCRGEQFIICKICLCFTHSWFGSLDFCSLKLLNDTFSLTLPGTSSLLFFYNVFFFLNKIQLPFVSQHFTLLASCAVEEYPILCRSNKPGFYIRKGCFVPETLSLRFPGFVTPGFQTPSATLSPCYQMQEKMPASSGSEELGSSTGGGGGSTKVTILGQAACMELKSPLRGSISLSL